jgi:hypothetical protein
MDWIMKLRPARRCLDSSWSATSESATPSLGFVRFESSRTAQ